MQTRRDGSTAYDKGERAALTKGAPLGGSSGRTRSDPRWRRGPQSEQEVHQRFHPDDFEVDSEQRLRLRASSVGAQAAVIPDDGLVTLPTGGGYVVLPLAAVATQVGDYITVDTAGDHFTLRGGSVYLVTCDVVYQSREETVYLTTTTKLSSLSGTIYDSRVVSLEDRGTLSPRITVRLSAVVDLSSSGSEDLDLQGKGSVSSGNPNGEAMTSRTTVLRIG